MSEVAIYKKIAVVPNPKTPAEIILKYLQDGRYIVVVENEITSAIKKEAGAVTVEAINREPERSFGE